MTRENGGYRPDNETYDVEGPLKALEKIKKNPKMLEKFISGAKNRAEDIFESGHLENEFKKGEKVLYVGAGTGHVAENIEKKTGATVIKIDLADLRAEDAKDNKFAKANVRRLPFQDGSLDTVCLFDMLHHAKGQEEILEEVKRVLKPGGKILSMEDTLPEPYEKSRAIVETLVSKMDDLFNQQANGVNPHEYKSISDWEIFFKEAGFDVKADDTKSWYWGAADFMGADRKKRPDHRTVGRPFEATMFKIFKPGSEQK